MTKLKAELANSGKTATNNRAGALCAMRKMTETCATVAEPFLVADLALILACLLYTSPSPRDATLSRMPSSA